MSSFYVNEPNATAKVLIHTTAGDLEIELWAKETPLTSRNFLQLCLDGYYNNTIFHRLVPGFVLQGGDPTGTGHGGEAIYQGGLFADEFHPRLKFSRRGLLGMANSGKKDDNGSQFFFTLSGDASVKELTGKNTLFGKVVGDSIYNLVKMGEMELEEEGSERMLYPVKITGTEVLINPFEDMVAREAEREKRKREQEEKERTAAAGAKKAVPKKRIAVGKKGKALLSFGEDLEEGEGDDVVLPVKKMKFDTRLVTDVPDATNSTSKPSVPEKSEKGKSLIKDKKPSSPSASRKSSPSPPPSSTTTKPTSKTPIPIPSRSPSSSPPPPSNDFLAKTNAQIAELKAALKRGADTALQLPPTSTTKKSLLDIQKDMLPITSIKGRKRKRNKAAGADADEFDDAAMDALERFKQKLQSATFATNAASLRSRSVDDGDSDRDETPDTEEARDDSPANPENGDAEKKDAKAGAEIDEDEEVQLCDLHFIPNCLSCQSWDKEKSNGKGAGASGARENDDIIRPEDLLGHTLRFGKDRFGKDLNWKKEHEYDDGLVVIDPREKGREILSEGGRGRGGRGGGTGRGGGGSWRGGGGGARGGGFGRGGGGGSGRRH